MALISSYPEVQARAHAELNNVIGRDDWPSVEDEQRLPYIRAIIKEVRWESWRVCLSLLTNDLSHQVLRIHSPFWVAAPHFSMEDFVYNGMYIPKNTALILNTYELHHNEGRYPDPYAPTFTPLISSKLRTSRNRFTFNPDRFLDDALTSEESSKLPNAMDRDHWAFGAGCVPKRLSPPSPRVMTNLLADSLLPPVVGSVQVSTSPNGSCGSRSHGCFGPMTSVPHPTSLYRWRNMMAILDACRYRIAFLSYQDMIESRRCWRRRSLIEL